MSSLSKTQVVKGLQPKSLDSHNSCLYSISNSGPISWLSRQWKNVFSQASERPTSELINDISSHFATVGQPVPPHLWSKIPPAEEAFQKKWDKLRKADKGLGTGGEGEVREYYEVRTCS